MTVKVGHVDVKEAKKHWPYYEPFVERAIKHSSDEYTPSDILKGIADQDYMMLSAMIDGVVHGVVILSLQTTPQSTFVLIDFLGGHKIEQWMTEAVDAVKVVAKSLGAKKVKAFGRRGWRKFEGSSEFKATRTVFEMEIQL